MMRDQLLTYIRDNPGQTVKQIVSHFTGHEGHPECCDGWRGDGKAHAAVLDLAAKGEVDIDINWGVFAKELGK